MGNMVWRIIEANSKPLEMATAGFIALMGLSCYFGGWFGGWLPSMSDHHGRESLVAVLCLLLAGYQIVAVLFDYKQLRWCCCMMASAFFIAFSLATLEDHGLTAPGGPMAFYGAIVQLWAAFSVASDMRQYG